MGNNKITGLANGTAATDAVAYGQVVHAAGQGRLSKVAGNLVLAPFNGNQIAINGAYQTIPAAGVSLAPGAVVATTLYFIYAFMVGAVMTLEASTTGHSTDVTTGVEIKTGDATRSLVGMARPIAGPLWQDTIANRFTISWFNRRPLQTANFFTTGRTTASGAFVELNTEIRNEFIAWNDSAASFWASGSVSNNTAATTTTTAFGFDSTTPLEGINGAAMPTGINNQLLPLGATTVISSPSEGYHFVTLLGTVSGGTGTWAGGTVGARCSIQGVIQG